MSNRTYLGLCAIAKDEDTIIREWVAYHHAIGFERIFIYDNDSKIPVRDHVADFYNQGIVESYTIAGPTMQLTAYNHFLQNHGSEFVWVAFFDLDEFLYLPQDTDARSLLAEFEEYPCLSVNWWQFGSSGHLRRPAGLVMQNFCEVRSKEVNGKCIVQPRYVTMPITPHHFLFSDEASPGMQMVAVNTSKEPAVGASAPPATDRARLYHYSPRSQEDYEARLTRGDAIYEQNPRSLEHFYALAQQKCEPETGMLRHVAHITEILRTGKARQYCPVESLSLRGRSLARILADMALALRYNCHEAAFVMFSVTFRIFCENIEFLCMGIRLALLCKYYPRAEALAQWLIRTAPTLASYMQLLTVQLEARNITAALRTAQFIRQVARDMQEPATDDAVLKLLQKYDVAAD